MPGVATGVDPLPASMVTATGCWLALAVIGSRRVGQSAKRRNGPGRRGKRNDVAGEVKLSREA